MEEEEEETKVLLFMFISDASKPTVIQKEETIRAEKTSRDYWLQVRFVKWVINSER